MRAWKILEALIREAKQYRGDSGWTLKQLNDLMQGSEHRPGVTGRPANREGEVVDADYKFDPSIWGKWYPAIEPALTMASTDKDVVGQYAGRSQGSMSFKTTWGQRVVNLPGKARSDFERLPSAMDTYDVLMQGEVGKDAKGRPVGFLKRIAYTPAIGSSDERRDRIQAMMAGSSVGPLKRRVQPDRPNPPEGSANDKNPAQPVLRVGQNVKRGKGNEE